MKKLKEHAPLIVSLLVLLATAGCLLLAVDYYLSLPIVYWSTSEDKCIKVIIDDQICDCEILEDITKYEKVWVE